MKKTFLGISLLVVILIASCQKEETNPATTTADRDKFLATWRVQETSQRYGATAYEMIISKDTSNTSDIIIQNINQLGSKFWVRALVSGSYFNISPQVVSGNIISGSGYLQSPTIVSLKYTKDEGGGIVDSLSCVLTKK